MTRAGPRLAVAPAETPLVRVAGLGEDPFVAYDAPVAPAAPTNRKLDEPRWEVCYALVFAATVAIVEAGPLTTAHRIVASVALAAMVPWYLCAGRSLTRPAYDGSPSPVGSGWRGVAFLPVLLVLFAVAQSQNPATWFIAFAITPMCLRTTTMRRGMTFVVVLNVTAAALAVWPSPGLATAANMLGTACLSIGLSYVLGRWVKQVVAQSEERAALIEQLESTRAELAAAHREAGIMAERHRIAGEIHDTLAQGFTSIVTLVQAAMAGLESQEPAREHLRLALATARENLAEARTLVSTLGPAGLEDGSLADAIRRAADSTGASGGMRACCEVTGTPRQLPTGTEVMLLRVCQEALANVRKHAAATRVDVRLAYGRRAAELTVADDGRGFDKGTVCGGYGLRGMRERARQAGGSVEVTTSPEAGTVVRAEVPG